MNARHRFRLRRLTAAACATFASGLISSCSEPADETTTRSSSQQGDAETVATDGRSMPPWPAPVADVPARVAAAGLDLGPMGMAEHYHPNLQIVVEGRRVQVPSNIGVDPATGVMSAVHTHETDGTIHIEADTVGEVFTLGHLFTQWGVKLTPSQIGGVEVDNAALQVTSNGRPVEGDPADLRLEPEQRIVLQVR